MTDALTTPLEFGIRAITVPGYEDIRLCEDRESGLRAIISLHDTTLGPALGGTRFWPYPNDEAALTDVLRLSRGMTQKAAAAGIPLGGGKAVIIGDPQLMKTPKLLRAYGRFVQSFGGRYITAADVGTTSNDLDVIGEITSHVVGRTVGTGGLGDSGASTALGVFVSMKAAIHFVYAESLAGVVVGVEGVGKVGFELISLLRAEGARVIASEPSAAARARTCKAYPDIEFVENVRELALDVYAPCALGATVTTDVAERISTRIICGAANNQLASDAVEEELVKRGVVWVPDFVANAGGLIQVAAERDGSSLDAARARIHGLSRSVSAILHRSQEHCITAGEAARSIVADRLGSASGSR